MAFALAACSGPKAVWTEGPVNENGKAMNSLLLQNVPAGSRVWFQELYDSKEVLEGPAPVHFQGTTFYVDIPSDAKGDVLIKYLGRPVPRKGWAPEGLWLQQKGKKDIAISTEYVFGEHGETEIDPSWFACNYSPGPADIIPRIKKIRYGNAPLISLDREPVSVKIREEDYPSGWYRISIDAQGKAAVEAADSIGIFYAGITLSKLPDKVREGALEDWPDLPVRGFMLDVARDFRTKEEIFEVLDIMASYKLNTLHFHLGEDESWSLEIPALPELAAFGGNHALPDWDLQETKALKPMAGGAIGNRSYYTESEYKEILRYAAERCIDVIPEFDAPGHSRASIKAMQAYERRSGDSSLRLQDPSDDSKYWTAQDFTDDVLSVELPGVYKFYGIVFDELIRMHKEAGVPLRAIHIGGDEVPSGVWAGKDRSAQKDYFTRRMLDLAEERGIKLAGWQEMALELTPETAERLKKSTYFLNAWSTHDNIELTYRLANEGFPVLLSNVNNAYVDLSYGDGFEDIGLNWGGYVDERKSFALQPWKIYESARWTGVDTPLDVSVAAEGKTPLLRPEMVIGAEALLWGEKVRSFGDVTYQIFPKALGVFERSWNASPSWPTDSAFKEDFDRFYSIVSAREMPEWDKKGYNYKKR